MSNEAQADPDAIDFLKADHERVKQMFRELESLRGIEEHEERKAELVEEICYELTLHAMLEEEIFYPAVRAAIDDDELIDEAEAQHLGTKDLVDQLEVLYPGDDHYDATVTVLTEEVEAHIAYEENEILPRVKRAKVDTRALGIELKQRKDELEEDFAAPPGSANKYQPARNNGRRPPRAPN